MTVKVTTILTTDDAAEWESIKAFALSTVNKEPVVVDDAARTITSAVTATWLAPDQSGKPMTSNPVHVTP